MEASVVDLEHIVAVAERCRRFEVAMEIRNRGWLPGHRESHLHEEELRDG